MILRISKPNNASLSPLDHIILFPNVSTSRGMNFLAASKSVSGSNTANFITIDVCREVAATKAGPEGTPTTLSTLPPLRGRSHR